MEIKILNIKFNLLKRIFLFLIILFSNQQANAVTSTFSYTGSQQTWTVPSGVSSITITAYGAAGGLGYTGVSTRSKGGKVTATLSVTPGATYQIYVGGQGGDATNGTSTTTGDGVGGFNGGANGGGGDAGGGGGGATDFRTSSNLSDRILVAGGAGGNGGDMGGLGGTGGGTTGGTGQNDPIGAPPNGGSGGGSSSGGSGGTGFSNGTNGSSGVGGVGGDPSSTAFDGGGGGGGGYYGGGGGGSSGTGASGDGAGAGGGSSFTSASFTLVSHSRGDSSATGNGSLVIVYSISITNTNPTTNKDVTGSIGVQSQLAKNTFTQSVRMVSNRLSHLRQNKDSQNLSKNNIKLDFGNATFTSLANELLAKNDNSIIPDNWSSWSEGSISVTKIGDSTNSSSSETDGQSLAIGFDTKLNDNDLLGFAIQYGKSDTDVGSSGTNIESENYNLSVYRTRPLNDDNFIEGSIGIGLIESDLKRVSGSNTLTGSRNGTQVFGSINYGKTIDKGDFNLTPIGRVDLGYTELDAYSETGTDALSYAKQTIESGLASLGFEFSDIVKLNKNSFKPFGSIEYGLDFSNSSDAKMNYVSDTSTIYTYTQGINSNHLITSVVGFEYITTDNLEIIISYKRIQGNESEKTDIIKFGINFKSQRETEYAMSIDGSEDLKAGFDISKNINGFDLIFNANQAFNENSDQTANVSLTKKF